MAKQINFAGYLIKQFGAYINTDLSGLSEINGVGSGIIGMIGLAEKGPVNTPVTVNSYTELVRIFGDGPLVRHGLAAYVGGASTVVCVRTGTPTSASLAVITIDSGTDTSGDSDSYVWRALEPGSLGNNISVSVVMDDRDTNDTTEDDVFNIYIRSADSQGNDVRETFVVPRFVPNPSGMFYTGNTDNYYLLRDRYTRVIRELPVSWGYGNQDEIAFYDKVAAMKSTDEDLIGPFPYGTGDTVFPIAFIAETINYGGFGFAPSELVRIVNDTPSMDDIITPNYVYDPDTADTFIAHPYVPLSGGHNGDDGTNFYGIEQPGLTPDYDATFNRGGTFAGILASTWGTALSYFEDEEVNFIQPAYLFNQQPGSNTNEWSVRYGFFKSLMPLFLAHVNTMSNVPNRRFRTTVTGLPYYKHGTTVNKTEEDFLEAIQDLPGLLNNDRIQCWVGGFKSRAFSSALEEYGGEMLASFVVGAHAARMVSVSLTFARLAGIFTDGLEFRWNQAQKDELYTRGLAFVMKYRNSTGATEYLAAHNYTTFTGSPSRGLQLFLTRRIVDYVNTFVYKNLQETFIGTKSLGAETEGVMTSYVTALLNSLVADGILVAYAKVVVKAEENDKTIYNVFFDMQPVSEIDFIKVTNKLVYSLA